MFHHNAGGEIENGEVRFQLKATDRLKVSRDGSWIAKQVDIRDLRYWYFDPYPMIAVLYDAKKVCGYWLDVQKQVDQNRQIMETKVANVSLRIPTSNRLTGQSIDAFRELSRQAVAMHLASRGPGPKGL